MQFAHDAVDAGESEDALGVPTMAPGSEAGQVEHEAAEAAYGPVAGGGDVLDRVGRTGGDGVCQPTG